MIRGPLHCGVLRQEYADSEGRFAIGGHVENVFSCGTRGLISDRRALAYEVVLVNVSLATGIGFHSADCHAEAIGRWSSEVGDKATSEHRMGCQRRTTKDERP
jgi:hypothetical protein